METATKKEVGLIVVATLLGLITLVSFVLIVRSSLTTPYLIPLAIVLDILWVSVASLALGLARHKYSIATLLIIMIGTVLIAGQASLSSIIGATVLLVAIVAGRRILVSELSERIHYRTHRSFSSGIRLLLTGIMVAQASLAVSSTEAVIATEGIQINEEFVANTLRPIDPFVSSLIPGLSELDNTASLDDVIATQNPSASETERELFKRELFRTLGIPDTPSSNMSITGALTAKGSKLLAEKSQAYPLVASAGLISLALVAIAALLPALSFLAIGLLVLIIWLARHIGLLSLSSQQVHAELLTL